ncbi:hypothetical protein [Candidatus Nitrosocosmicus sp. SS]|jgi:hypothetical protein|uniref:hypothetical protein n=1 Tax=Candidatus Nitrosocosmicus agrestis TaxID=2563600 RepID=UPI00122E3749|nr:hypothetical protein [Candidatus Nitrosocosmicus sp. SS]KAA2283742.1 hypothetical protein F1Z66_00170 [Candidatus Nitrosocosmicus sp. SS]KAF0870118.1 hypothetical protein E5N71_00895 [Candidatus Nitrosocosmicus sp. SS]
MSSSWHIKKSNHNIDACNYMNVKTPQYMDWEVVSIFYSSLHLINAYFEKFNPPVPSKHNFRNERVRRDPNLTKIRAPYLSLYTVSRSVRYDRDVSNDSEVKAAMRDYNLIKNHLKNYGI